MDAGDGGDAEKRFFLERKNQRTFGLRGSMGVLQTGMVQLKLKGNLSLLT